MPGTLVRNEGMVSTDKPTVWREEAWRAFEERTRRVCLEHSEANAWRAMVRAARRVMRRYTTSFFMVSRFLPRAKRDRVEIIYAAVRYPDEVVDSFPLSATDRSQRLSAWRAAYERALACADWREALASGTPCFVAAFSRVVREAEIPPEHYRAFLDAMQLDADPGTFETLDDLVDRYIYGSAIVVGYFLTHVYGASAPERLPHALDSARHLGIALQLTNFLRDVTEDHRRGRLYLPMDRLRARGVERIDLENPACRDAMEGVIRDLAEVADQHYAESKQRLDAFAPDSRVAIRACIDVYGQLNRLLRNREHPLRERASVPLRDKWRVLPATKYWRIPLAWITP